MIVVGIHNTGIASSAAIVADGVLRYACVEERLNRQKYSKTFPIRSIESGLAHIGADLNDVDFFAIGWNPAINIAEKYRAGFSEWPAYPGERFYSNANHLLPLLKQTGLTATEQIFHRESGRPTKIIHVSHHLAHAATAYYASGFDQAAILTCDSYGEKATTAWYHAHGGHIDLMREIRFPHSIGQLYSAVTQFLGFRPHLDEWKVMGAAAYGNPAVFRDKLNVLIHRDKNAGIELDLRYFEHFDFDTAQMFSGELTALLGQSRNCNDAIEQHHFDIAASLQEITESYLISAVKWLKSEIDCPNLCLSGGVIMNSVFNGRIAAEQVFENIYVPFAPDDSGNSIGAALWTAFRSDQYIQQEAAANPFLGRAYTDAEIENQLEASNLRIEPKKDIITTTADLLDQGKIVGWFQGRMEFGQRALGARSILADPRKAEMKERINKAVKFREPFRPFAPAILAERTLDWFEIPSGVTVPYMEKVFRFKSEKRCLVPSVVHIDGSGRLQMVDQSLTPQFHSIIKAFEKLSGIPILLNTSFNINNEPVVESPIDAIRTFYSSGLDAVAIGSFLIQK